MQSPRVDATRRLRSTTNAGSRTRHLERAKLVVVVRNGPRAANIGPMVHVELERVEALELLGMTLAHLNVAEASGELSPRIPLLMAVRDKLAGALREES